MTINICSDRKFEWRNGELFLVSDSVSADTAWVDSLTIEEAAVEELINNAGMPAEEVVTFIIQRLESGDKVFSATSAIVFAGGDVLYFIEPVKGLH